MTKHDLIKWQESHNLTTAQLATMLPVSRRTIEGWRQGRNIPAYLKRALADLERELRPPRVV